MLEFTMEQVKLFCIGVILFTLLYIFLYHKKGNIKSFSGYINAIRHSLSYSILLIVIIVAVGLVRFVEPIIYSLIYLVIVLIVGYNFTGKFLNEDFNLNIKIIKLSPIKKQQIIINIYRALKIILLITAVLMFIVAFYTDNIDIIILLIIGGIIFACPVMLHIIMVKSMNIYATFIRIYRVLAVLFACLCLTLGLSQLSKYKDLEETYLEVPGQLIATKKVNHYKHTIAHYPIYLYEVNGKKYIVKSEHVTSIFAFNDATILYNPINPREAIVKSKINWWLIFAVIFGIIMPLITIPFYKKVKNMSNKDCKITYIKGS